MESMDGSNLPVPQSEFTRLSLFYGIAIEMGFEDEEPPHIHALYEDKDAKIGFDNQVLGWLAPSNRTGDGPRVDINPSWRTAGRLETMLS